MSRVPRLLNALSSYCSELLSDILWRSICNLAFVASVRHACHTENFLGTTKQLSNEDMSESFPFNIIFLLDNNRANETIIGLNK